MNLNSIKNSITFCMVVCAATAVYAQADQQPRYVPPPPQKIVTAPPLSELHGYDELPLEIRQQVKRPQLEIHQYSDDPAKRYALINGFRGREGLPIGQELWIHEIIPQGVVLRVQDRFILVTP